MLLPDLTLTGIDICTNVQSLVRHIHDKFTNRKFELAMLYKGDVTDASSPRYVSLEFACRVADAVMHSEYNRGNITCALHVCGKARSQLTQNPEIFSQFDRVQVNGRITEAEMSAWLRLAAMHDCMLVFQRYTVNSSEHDLLLSSSIDSNFSILQDASGGRGILNTNLRVFPKASASIAVGFAGGFTPDNIYSTVLNCEVADYQEWWLDLESGLRDELDVFCLSKAMKCIDQFVKATERLDLKHELDRVISDNLHVKNDAAGCLLELARECLITDKWPDASLLDHGALLTWRESLKAKKTTA